MASTLFETMKFQFPDLSGNEIFAKILCGEVLVDGERERNPKIPVTSTSVIEVKEPSYVSRGGLKLEKALKKWNIRCDGKTFLDAGSSTGGFTECLLRFGAAGVHAVDVGYNQLAYRLRTDSRVFVHEKTNIMALDILDPRPDAGVADLSFRSIHGAAAKIFSLIKGKWIIALIKPQFEIDRMLYPRFDGVIKDPSILLETVYAVIDRFVHEGISVSQVMLSPIKGRKGNTEFLFLLRDTEEKSASYAKKEVKKLVLSLK